MPCLLSRALLSAGCVAITLIAAAVHAADPARPNIILCMADDQGWGDVAYNGHPVLKTPHLDAMSEAGLRFDHFYAAAPVCSPTRASVMTGRHPNRMGCFSWGHPLRPQEWTIAEALQQAGYVTGHFGKWHLGSVRPGSPVNPGASGFDQWLSAENFYDNDPILSRQGRAVQIEGESSDVAAEAALQFIRQQQQSQASQPFLAVVWFGSPHSPHIAAEEDRRLYADQGKKADFLGEITGIDRAVGKLRSALREMEIHENTVFWYCSDNGGLMPESSGGREKKGSIYEGGLRVPAIIEWPARIEEGRIVDAPANTVDIFPTLLDLVGIVPVGPEPLDGISLKAVIDGSQQARSQPMGFWSYPARGISTPSAAWMAELLEAQQAGREPGHPERLRLDAAQIEQQYPEDSFPGHSAWIAWPWKLHRIQPANASGAQPVKWELYNLSDDPLETENVASNHPDRVEPMQRDLEKWLTSVARSMNGEDYR